MLTSILLACGGFTLLAIVAIIDKYIVSGEHVRPVVFVFYSTILALPLVLFMPFTTLLPSAGAWAIAIVSGVCYALALGAMYRGFLESEVSHVGPLIGAAVPIFTFIINNILSLESLTTRQIAAVSILIIGSITSSFEKSHKHRGWHRGLLWGILAGFLFALFYIGAKYIYSSVGFYAGLVWVWGAMGGAGALLLVVPSVRCAVFGVTFRRRVQSPVGIIVIDKLFALGGVALIQYAVTIGSVTIINALTGLQYGVLITLVAFLSRFHPRVFKEKYLPGEAVQELVAVLIIALGLGLLLI